MAKLVKDKASGKVSRVDAPKQFGRLLYTKLYKRNAFRFELVRPEAIESNDGNPMAVLTLREVAAMLESLLQDMEERD